MEVLQGFIDNLLGFHPGECLTVWGHVEGTGWKGVITAKVDVNDNPRLKHLTDSIDDAVKHGHSPDNAHGHKDTIKALQDELDTKPGIDSIVYSGHRVRIVEDDVPEGRWFFSNGAPPSQKTP